MKKLEYGTLAIDDFCSISSLEVNLRRPGSLWFIFGENRVEPGITSNGCGKTTIFNALCWVQFGKTVRNLRSTDIIPWSGGTPFVELCLWIDGTGHELTRGANPNQLLFDGQPIDQGALEDKLGMNFDTFINSILLGQEQDLFLDRTPSEKLKLFTDALNLERWDTRSKQAAADAERLHSEIDRDAAVLTRMVQQFREVKELHENAKNEADQWVANQETIQKRADSELKEAEKFVKQLQRRHDDATLAYDGAGLELQPITRELRQQQDYLRANELELARAETQRQSIIAQRETLKSELEEVKRGRCPTCGQRWDKKHAKPMEDRLADLAERSSARILKPIADLNRRLKADVERLSRDHQRFTQQQSDAREILDSVIPRLADLNSQISRIRQAKAQYTDAVNPFRQQLADLKQRRARLAAEYKTLTKDHKDKKEKLERVSYWVKGFKDIKLFIIEELLQELQLCSDAIHAQLGLNGWSLIFDVEKETAKGTVQRGLNVFVKSPYNRKPVKWECWSGGESQRLRIAASLALAEVLLARCGVDPNLEALDEPTRGLSKQGVDDLVDFLAIRARQLDRGIFFIEQTVVESSQFAGTMFVSRTEDGTSIIE